MSQVVTLCDGFGIALPFSGDAGDQAGLRLQRWDSEGLLAYYRAVVAVAQAKVGCARGIGCGGSSVDKCVDRHLAREIGSVVPIDNVRVRVAGSEAGELEFACLCGGSFESAGGGGDAAASSDTDDGRSAFVASGGGACGVAGTTESQSGQDVGGGRDSLGVASRGKWYRFNKKKRERKRQNRVAEGGVVAEADRSEGFVTGRCETVVSQQSVPEWRRKDGKGLNGSFQRACPSYGQALSDAEREAKESLARRRAAENAVAEKLARMKLESLEDEKKCQEYAELKKQRVIQWTNEATAKSQQSLEKCKSIDPSSSSSQYEIRQQAKKLADLDAKHNEFVRRVADIIPNCAELLESCKPPGTATMEFYEAQAGYYSDACSVDPVGEDDDLDKLLKARMASSGYDPLKPKFLIPEVDPLADD